MGKCVHLCPVCMPLMLSWFIWARGTPAPQAELCNALATSIAIDDRPSCFRFPRGNGIGVDLAAYGVAPNLKGTAWEVGFSPCMLLCSACLPSSAVMALPGSSLFGLAGPASLRMPVSAWHSCVLLPGSLQSKRCTCVSALAMS